MPEPGTEGPLPAQIETWELELAQGIAREYRTTHKEDLAAELAAAALSLKQRRPDEIKDWKAYLATCLRHRASRLVGKWRDQQKRETSADLIPEATHPFRHEEPHTDPLESRFELSQIRDKLDRESYTLLQQLAAANWNQSRLARLRGLHRNTIRQRLQKIRQRLECPIENVSGRLRLTTEQRVHLANWAQSARSREAFNARLILALDAGQSYAEIQNELKTSAPTISRWKHRFKKSGIDGLKVRHPGKKARADVRVRLANWLRASEDAGRLSCRKLARKFGVSKSMVHRILSGGERP